MASEAVIPNEERILSAWAFTVGVIRARMVVVFSINEMWHICSYKQVVVLPYVYFGAFRENGYGGVPEVSRLNIGWLIRYWTL